MPLRGMQNASDRDRAKLPKPPKRQRHPGKKSRSLTTPISHSIIVCQASGVRYHSTRHREPGPPHTRNGADPLHRRPRNTLRLSPSRPRYRNSAGSAAALLGKHRWWDPAVVNALAADRPVIAFDNAGVGRSTGQTPDNIATMARDAVDFINLLGFLEVDLLGFSLGGCIAQQIAAEHGRLVRKLMLVGTAPKGGEEHLLAVLQEAFSQTDAPDPRLPLFFTNSSASRSSGLAFLKERRFVRMIGTPITATR